MSNASPESSEQFASARDIAERWACHVDTVYARLQDAGIRQYRFSARLIRWRWTDILQFEDELAEPTQLAPPIEVITRYAPRKQVRNN